MKNNPPGYDCGHVMMVESGNHVIAKVSWRRYGKPPVMHFPSRDWCDNGRKQMLFKMFI